MTETSRQLIGRVAATIRDHGLLRAGDTVVVACSGGADSTALLDILCHVPGMPLTLVVAHLNHCLRGAESDGDEEYCRYMAHDRSLPFVSARVDVAALARDGKTGLEDAGRRARIGFLEEVRHRHGASAVALAHHADDQAETFMMRLLRGSGSAGLSGMSFRTGRGHIRPLLDVSRNEIESYLRERAIPWREDASNRDTSFLRNRIRHEVMPLLAGCTPRARERLTETAALLGRDNDLLDQLASEEYERLACRQGGRISFEAAGTALLHPALAARLVRRAVCELTGDLLGLAQCHIAGVLALVGDGLPNRRISLPGRLAARREYRLLVLERCVEPETAERLVRIDGPGSYPLWEGCLLQVQALDVPADDRSAPDVAVIDLDAAPFPWLVRTFRPGDRIRPVGMQGHRKVKELFIDRKVPLPLRRSIPLLFSGGRLAWVAGMRLSADAALTDVSLRAALVRLCRPLCAE